MEMKQKVLRQYLESIKPPQRGQLTSAAVLLAPSSIVLNHYVLLKFTAQVTSQAQFIILLLRHLPTAMLWHHSTPKLLLGLSICHTAPLCFRETPLPALSQAPMRDSAGTGSLVFCTYLGSVSIIYFLFLFLSYIEG